MSLRLTLGLTDGTLLVSMLGVTDKELLGVTLCRAEGITLDFVEGIGGGWRIGCAADHQHRCYRQLDENWFPSCGDF